LIKGRKKIKKYEYQVRKISEQANLCLSSKEISEIAKELESIISYALKIKQLDLDKIE